SGRIIGDTGATLPATWLIRAPASLRVLSVVTPSTVFLGQTGIPVDVTVENTGDKNAAGLWDSTALQFDLGSYLNIQPQSAFPLTIYAAQASTVRYLLEVDPLSATGPTNIDAWITYRDINLMTPTNNFDGALFPGQWTIVAGFVNTYKDGARLIKAQSFNQGNYTVFAKAENLAPLKEHRLRWYNPSGVQVAFSDPAVQTTETGSVDGEFELTPASPLGTWRVVGTRVFDTIPLCENTFEVVAPANLSLFHSGSDDRQSELNVHCHHELLQYRRSPCPGRRTRIHFRGCRKHRHSHVSIRSLAASPECCPRGLRNIHLHIQG
ncbi:MAG TPA: hypothetical protein PKM25_16025, partial [Candidatus Ozemobacteraceae bacterium]|nr:hypothetical protein [Candidatus Ozemobacteraceae bacterium]